VNAKSPNLSLWQGMSILRLEPFRIAPGTPLRSQAPKRFWRFPMAQGVHL